MAYDCPKGPWEGFKDDEQVEYEKEQRERIKRWKREKEEREQKKME